MMVRSRTTSVKGPQVEVPDNVLFETWLVSRAATALLDDALGLAGLTADEFAVYSVLSSGPVPPGELARWMAAPATTVSSYVRRFEQRGHVAREPNPDDGRSYLLRLTPEGRRVHRRAGQAFGPVLHEVEAVLGGDGRTVGRALGTLRDALDDVAGRRA
jgi:DNA-binding MarR family transcriptional regulator